MSGKRRGSYLKQRGDRWYFAIAVPRDLREAYGKDHVVLALGTDSRRMAQVLCEGPLAKYRELFTRMREGRPVSAPPDAQALLEIDAFARATYHEWLAKMETSAAAWGAAELFKAWGGVFDDYCAEDYHLVAGPLTRYCAQHAIAPGSELFKVAGNALLVAKMHAVNGRKLAIEHQPSDEPKTFLAYVPVDPVSLKPLRARGQKRGGSSFADVADRFITERQRDPAYKLTKQTVGQYEAAFRLFDQWAKQPRLDEIDRSKASAFLDAISSFHPHWGRGPGVKAMPFDEIANRFGGSEKRLSAKTINRYAMALSMVWQYAEDRDGYQGANPWTRQSRPTAKRRGSSETSKRGFKPAEIADLLEHGASPVPANDVPSTLRWLTLIGAYSGMRLNEICELDVDDVKDTGGILFFDLTEAKTEAGVRCVPVHSKILAAGFREYISNVKTGALWPGLKPGGPDGKKSWYVSKRFTDYRRALKLVDLDPTTGRDRLDYHSLRRSAVTALKRAGIPEHDVAEVVGHEHPRVTFGVYPDRQQLARLKAIVEAIRYGNDH